MESASAAMALSASMVRDSSPPEAMRLSGRGASPALADMVNSTVSQPSGDSALACRCSCTSTPNSTFAMPKSCKCPFTCAANLTAAARRAWVSCSHRRISADCSFLSCSTYTLSWRLPSAICSSSSPMPSYLAITSPSVGP